jgi:hypothetical protein
VHAVHSASTLRQQQTGRERGRACLGRQKEEQHLKYSASHGYRRVVSSSRVGGERTTCASTASSLNLRRANARRPLTQQQQSKARQGERARGSRVTCSVTQTSTKRIADSTTVTPLLLLLLHSCWVGQFLVSYQDNIDVIKKCLFMRHNTLRPRAKNKATIDSCQGWGIIWQQQQ